MKKILSVLFFVVWFAAGIAFPPSAHGSISSAVKDFITSLKSSFSEQSSPAATTAPTPVLGDQSYNTEAPRIYLNGGNNSYSSGGLIMQASTDDPAVFIGGYKVPDGLDIKIYRASLDDVITYLIHDKEYAQKNTKLDTARMTLQTTIHADLSRTNDYDNSRQSLPIDGKGIWYLDMTGSGVSATAFIVRSDHGVILTEGDNEWILWAQKYTDLHKVESGGTVRLYSLLDSQRELNSTNYDGEGISKFAVNEQADIAVSTVGDDVAIVPINLTYLNVGYGYAQFRKTLVKSRYFTFTDRPLYLPGDTVHFKSVIRDDYDARYAVSAGLAYVSITQYTSSGQSVQKELTLPISSDGTIAGDYKLDSDAKTGYYSITVKTARDRTLPENYYGEYTGSADMSSASFNVEYYRKPETMIEIETAAGDVIAGTPAKITVAGSYFSGQPMSGQQVKYRVTAADYYEYSYMQDKEYYQSAVDDSYRYGAWYGSHNVKEDVVTLDKQGTAVLDIPTDMSFNEDGKSQIFMIEATLQDGSQDPAFARKNILVHAGEFGIYATEYKWGAKVNSDIDLPLVLDPYRSDSKIAKIDVTATVVRNTWKIVTDKSQKYPRYEYETVTVADVKMTTDVEGKGVIRFKPDVTGSYNIKVKAKDRKGNTVGKQFYMWVTDKDYPVFEPGNGSAGLTITSDKKTYDASERAKIELTSEFADRDVFLAIERGHIRRYQIVRLQGKSGSVDVQLNEGDLPNIYARASSFSTYMMDTASIALSLDTSSKKMNVSLTPDKPKYGPGDTVTLNISTTNGRGTPVSGEIAVWTVDKALLELMDSRLGDIFKTFWSERADSTDYSHSLKGILVQTAERGGGCFTGDTLITMADGSTRQIQDVRKGDKISTFTDGGQLTVASVTDTSKATEDGYIIINGMLKATPDHIINVNGTWQEAGKVRTGDILRGTDGPVTVTDVAWQAMRTDVYNLTVEREHTFIANGLWVHNQKGGDRSVFKDVAYWNPYVRTDSSGRAAVTFKLPDNLTTWVIQSVGANGDNVFGQSSVEIKTVKDIVIKPILPSVVRSGDKLTLSAIARNFTDTDDSYNLSLNVKGADVEDPLLSKVSIKSFASEQIYWRVRPQKDAKTFDVKMSVESVTAAKNRDAVETSIPVVPFGFTEKSAEFKPGETVFDIKLAEDAVNDKSSVTLSLAPTMVGSLQSAMKYLLNYPYGCVEQLTSRLAPALTALRYPALFQSAMEGKNVDEYVKTALEKLSESRSGSGAWAWWSHGETDAFVTSYVLESLIEAKGLGYTDEVNSMIAGGISWLQHSWDRNQGLTDEEKAIRRYGLALSGVNDDALRPVSLDKLEPDTLAMAVLAAKKLNDSVQVENGLKLLAKQAKEEGDSVYWPAAGYKKFGSVGASTAWAVRALTEAGGDRDLAAKGVRYLVSHRSSDYWYNSYATAVTSRAILGLYSSGGENAPSYALTVKLDDKVIKTGNVGSADRVLKDIEIPVTSLKKQGSKLSVDIEGSGQIYSTLAMTQFHTDPEAKADSRGMTLTREYINDRDPNYSIALGDIVQVKLTISGLNEDAHYAVIEDQLPAGLIPVNEAFKNEQFNQNNGSSWDSYYWGWSGKQYTQNGAILSAYNVGTGDSAYNTFTYKARVVSMGTFQIPPATASLMYSPDVNARTSTDTLTITTESKLLPGRVAQSALKTGFKRYYLFGAAFGILVVAAVIRKIMKKRRAKQEADHSADIPKTPDSTTDSV